MLCGPGAPIWGGYASPLIAQRALRKFGVMWAVPVWYNEPASRRFVCRDPISCHGSDTAPMSPDPSGLLNPDYPVYGADTSFWTLEVDFDKYKVGGSNPPGSTQTRSSRPRVGMMAFGGLDFPDF